MSQQAAPIQRAKDAQLTRHPLEASACGGCTFYAPRHDAEGYCAQPQVQLDVMANWWCKYYEGEESRAKVAGHPAHPALVPFPLALTGAALICDVLAQTSGRPQWRQEARHALVGSVVGGLLAAPMGLLDWLSLPAERPAKTYGLVHGLANLGLLAINGANLALRGSKASAGQRGWEVGLSALATALLLGSGWIGRQLAYRQGVGVELPTRPYRILDLAPVVRLWGNVESRLGGVRLPAQSVWNGPVVPSQPLPEGGQDLLAAS